MAASQSSLSWIRSLAEPYLRGYRAIAQRSGHLRGYWFVHAAGEDRKAQSIRLGHDPLVGFFAGYLLRADDFLFLRPEPPECLVFASVSPLEGRLHDRLVRQPTSLLRETFGYIRWLTHRPPRFSLFDDQLAALVRHQPMGVWPPGKHAHLSRNFFIETLAWLVRSGLVRKLLVEPLCPVESSKPSDLKHAP